MLATFTVTSTGDAGTGSLRDAVDQANAAAGTDEVVFDAGLMGQTISMTSGQIVIDEDLTISGLGANQLTIDAGGTSRIFAVDDGTSGFIDVTIRDLTLTGGTPQGTLSGGAIAATENLTIERSTISGNTATSGAGAIRQYYGSLTVTDSQLTGNETHRYSGGAVGFSGTDLHISGSTVADNTVGTMFTLSGQFGGGLWFDSTGNVTVENTEFSGNTAGGHGGGAYIRDAAAVEITGTTIENNIADGRGSNGGDGGGLFVRDVNSLAVTNTTIAGNTATDALTYSVSDGGGLYGRDVAATTIANTTISGNYAEDDGGAAFLSISGGSGTAELTSTTISGNSAGDSAGGILLTASYTSAATVVRHSTITDNAANENGSAFGTGGGLSVLVGSVALDHTIVADNRVTSNASPDIFTSFNVVLTADYSIVGDNEGSGLAEAQMPDANGTLIGSAAGAGVIDPALNPLADNGGPTETHRPGFNSPASDAGDPNAIAGTGSTPADDQRGFFRVFRRIDIGAYEHVPHTLWVDTLADEDDGSTQSGDVSLREAVIIAQTVPGANVGFDPSLSGGTITLGLGRIDIYESLEIIGPGADQLTIDAAGTSRIFRISDDDTSTLKDVTIRDLTLTGGLPVGLVSGGAITAAENLTLERTVLTGNTATSAGGAVRQFYGALTVIDSEISNNATERHSGGGIAFSGTDLFIQGSTVTNNQIGTLGGFTVDGGGVWFNSAGSLTISESTISQNSATDDGGGLWAFGATNLLIEESIFAGNLGSGTASDGGGMFLQDVGSMLVTHTTVSDNLAVDDAGGIYIRNSSAGDATITNSTISGNRANDAAGGVRLVDSPGVLISHSTITNNEADTDNSGVGVGGGIEQFGASSITLDHTIVAGNTDAGAAPDVEGTPTVTATFSLIGDNTGSGLSESQAPDAFGNLVGSASGTGTIDPLLGPLADNGGPTLTQVPLIASPVVDAGDPAFALSQDFDQRGAPRAFRRIDMGAVEFVPHSLVVDTITDESDGDSTLGDLSLREAILFANAGPDPNSIQFDPGLAGGAILLTAASELLVSEPVDIVGLGASQLTIDGRGISRIFHITNDDDVDFDATIESMTLTGGYSAFDAGSAIRSTENLTLRNTTITGNNFSAVFQDNGTLYAIDSQFTNNSGGLSISRSTGSVARASFVDNTGRSLSVEDSTVYLGDSEINNTTGVGVRVIAFDYFPGFTQSEVTIVNTTITGTDGAGVFASGQNDGIATVNVLDSAISGTTNYTLGASGRGISLRAATLSMSRSTISGNIGAGVRATTYASSNLPGSTVMIDSSTIDDNFTGVHATGGTLSVLNSTISNNNIGVDGSSGHEIKHTTIAGNIIGVYTSAGLMLDHTIVGDSTFADLEGFTALDADHSLIEDPGFVTVTGANNLLNVDPRLGPLTDNGGPTLTHALLADSPALDAGNQTFTGPPDFDQRGAPFDRVVGGRIDMGAFELEATGAGDFNDDGVYDVVDIDALVAEIAAGTNNPAFDITGDGLVNTVDRDAWLAEAGDFNLGAGREYLLGDATLDGVVDGVDFISWNSNKFTSTPAWSAGDFNADGVVDGSDFILWNNSKFQSADVGSLRHGEHAGHRHILDPEEKPNDQLVPPSLLWQSSIR